MKNVYKQKKNGVLEVNIFVFNYGFVSNICIDKFVIKWHWM